MFDQEYRLIHEMSAVLNIHDIVSHVSTLKGAQIHTLNNSQRMLLRWIFDAGVNIHG